MQESKPIQEQPQQKKQIMLDKALEYNSQVDVQNLHYNNTSRECKSKFWWMQNELENAKLTGSKRKKKKMLKKNP